MSDDDTWVSLFAATRNVLVWLSVNDPGLELGGLSTGAVTFSPREDEPAAIPENVCSGQSSNPPTLKNAGSLHLRQRG